MGIPYHTIMANDGLALNNANRVFLGSITATYTAAGAGAATTPVVLTWTEPVPTPFSVFMSPIEDCTWFITAKTTLGCTLNVLPRLAANSLAGGVVQLLIIS